MCREAHVEVKRLQTTPMSRPSLVVGCATALGNELYQVYDPTP